LATIPYEIVRDKTVTTHDYLYKLIIIGDSCKYRTAFKVICVNLDLVLVSAVGKSCLLSRVMDEEFKVEH